MNKLATIVNGVATARHTVALALIAATGIVGGTLLFAQVDANEEKTIGNVQKIEDIQRSLNSIDTKQQVIIQQIKNEEEKNKEFRDRTDSSLDRILDRLPPRNSPIR